MGEKIINKDNINCNVKNDISASSNILSRDISSKIEGFWEDESGMGVVEIVLIIIVLVGLVVLFKGKITSMVETLLSKMSTQANQV